MLTVLALAFSLAAVIDPSATQAQLCKPGYASAHRNVPESVKLHMYKAAGIKPPFAGNWVIDHRCPLELGCMNVQANLQIQDFAAGKRKDRIEDATWRAVCVTHTLTLAAGRQIFATRESW